MANESLQFIVHSYALTLSEIELRDAIQAMKVAREGDDISYAIALPIYEKVLKKLVDDAFTDILDSYPDEREKDEL